ncbi:unnamed protein product [Mytilus coruscus]|uniref:Uncharacterized protein n=1 Tax=Mytilus coruscus TaxID=42192 RepID=A0A6J8EWS3_MYTCO|nr:unnamed protein product [Mytilus coruscus]
MALQTISGQNVENMFKKVNLYDNYKKNLLQNRSFIIQVYDEEKVIAIMNDYDDESGEFRSSDYVKTSRDLFENGYFYTCNCRIYRTLLESLDNNMEQYDALDENEVSPNLERNEQATVTNIQVVIQDALLYKDRKIIELPTTRPGTKKFSILIDDDISLVHLTFNSRLQRYIVSCLNGLCKSKKGCKKNVDCLNTDQNLCVHLSELKNAPHFWTEFSKPEAAVNTENDENIQLIDQEIQEITGNAIEEEIPTMNSCDSNFDVTSGLWSFPCISSHKPRKQQDPNLVQNIQHRYILGALNLNNVENGCIKGPHLIPDIPTSVCPCGAGWTSNQQLNGVTTFSRVLTIYTKIAPVQCQVYSRSCINEESPCKKDWDEGDKECSHVVTRDTAAGDEIGWAFVNQVLSTKITFSAFCDLKTKDYKECNPNFRSFMDSSVFIKWWFSWASNMKIDFRKPCPICKFRPKQLACDGTKVGIGFRHASFDEISKPDNPDIILPTLHRRMARCFLFDRVGDKEQLNTARHHLNYLAKLNLDKVPPQEILSDEETQQRNNILLEILDNSVRPSFERFLNNMPDVEKISYAFILHMLCTTAPVISLIPYLYLNNLTELLDHISVLNINAAGNGFYNRKMYEMREYAPELRDLIASSMLSHANPQGNNFVPDDVITFIRYLIKCVADMAITQPDPANPQPGTYNPAKYGRAYYFSETGEKLRPVRKFTIDGEKRKNPAYDDPPLPHDNCEKYFSKTQISARGTSTLFLWFCPSHGHCYGFHMTNAEGRKHPSASLYSHLEHPPTDIFYDFACNLQEYCLNRESGYYRCVRFFHDIFHGYSHKCSCAYRSSRLQGFDTINSEICEQFNSFIQCIKSSARQMTQEHFCFYLQFFLHEWNERKREKYQKRIAVAVAGGP